MSLGNKLDENLTCMLSNVSFSLFSSFYFTLRTFKIFNANKKIHDMSDFSTNAHLCKVNVYSQSSYISDIVYS